MGSWWCSPVRTTCVLLDHGGPTVVPECGMRISASGARRRRAPRSARSPGNRRARHLTREHVPLADVLAGQVTISRTGRVTTCETPSHHARCTIGAKRGRGAGTAPAAARAAPDGRPTGPAAPDHPRRTRTPPQQPFGRGGPARADRHHDLHSPRLQNHPRITFTVRRASRGPPEPLGRSPTAPPVTPCRRTHPRWGGWGSWDGLRWGRVQICCKGAPGRDRPREEARNINVSSRTLRRDPGLCNRFGQPAPPGSSPRGGRRLGGSRDERPGDPAGRDAGPPGHSGRPRRPDVHFALESAVPTAVLECEMHVSTRSPPR